MQKWNRIICLVCAVMGLFIAHAQAGTLLTDTLYKDIEEANRPFRPRKVKIEVVTVLDGASDSRTDREAFEVARKVHENAVREFNKNGWHEDRLAVEDVDAGRVEIMIGQGMNLKLKETLRIQTMIRQCGGRGNRIYRGGDVGEYFRKEVALEAEDCLARKNGLKWIGWPYSSDYGKR